MTTVGPAALFAQAQTAARLKAEADRAEAVAVEARKAADAAYGRLQGARTVLNDMLRQVAP